MNISIVQDSFKTEECFNKEKFNIDFKSNGKIYTTEVSCNKEQTIYLEESTLIYKGFCSSYTLNDKEIHFYITLIYEDYDRDKKYNQFTSFSSFSID